jgi:hypothetical protein
VAEVADLNKKCREWRLLMEQLTVDQPEAAPAPVPAPAPAPAMQPSQQGRMPQFLPKFRHGKDSIQEPENFLRQFKLVLEAQSFDVKQQWHHFLILCLTAEDARWVAANLAPSLDWEAVARAFTRQFGDPYRVREARLTLFRLQMRPGETLAEYTRRFEDHMRMANMPDTEVGAAAYFLSTLPHALRYHVDSAIAQLQEPEPTVKLWCNAPHGPLCSSHFLYRTLGTVN